MDSTAAFEAVGVGSNPAGGTKEFLPRTEQGSSAGRFSLGAQRLAL